MNLICQLIGHKHTVAAHYDSSEYEYCARCHRGLPCKDHIDALYKRVFGKEARNGW